MNILVVDDHPESRYLQETILRASGHEIYLAENGQEALELLGKRDIDLIVSDILMPVMDGFQFCRKVKTDVKYRSIPFIIYTATYTGPKDKEFAMKIGADLFLLKPCEPDIYMNHINNIMAEITNRENDSVQEDTGEEEVLRLYSERLVRKLEQKMTQLEQEVQARDKAEKNLRASEKKYRLLADNTLDVIWTMSPELVFTYVNPAVYRLTGITPKKLVGTRLSDHCDQEHFSEMTRVIADEIAKGPDGTGSILESEILTNEGVPIPIEVHGRVIFDDKGNPVSLQGVARDISERKELETKQRELRSQLFQAQKMESVGRLAGGVAHDFNNKLSIILAYSEFAMENLQPNNSLYHDLLEIKKAAENSKDIVRQLLAFARQQIIAPKVIDLNDTIESLLKMLRRLIGEDIDLSWHPGSDLWSINIDPSQIDQIVANLCVNARDAITDVGKVTIETGNASFDDAYCAVHAGFSPGEYVMLGISDDGCGIEPENLDNIFEPFFTTKSMGKGTGLGLATVYGIARQNKGFINVYSEPGNGTTFKVYLPRHKGSKDEEEKYDREIPKGKGETIMVVEDNLAVMNLTRRILTKLGYQVLETHSPGEALLIADEYGDGIHLLITDVVMPEMNGRDLSDKLHKVYPKLKTLYMSGYTADVIAHRGVLEEGVHFIQKPFSKQDLARKIRAALDED